MADLMSASTSYKKLASDYGNFLVPKIKIKVGGADVITTLGLQVAELEVVLSLSSASSATFKIEYAYDESSHCFDAAIKTKFKLGTIVEIELGYLSSTEKVFKGYVDGLGAEYGESPSLIVRLMDARRLMMQSGRSQIIHDVKNYSDAFKAVIGNYSQLCSAEIDATSDSLTSPITQSSNDYNFIVNELIGRGRAPREFFIFADKAYFRTPAKVGSPIMTVKHGRELLDISLDSGYLNFVVNVSGYDTANRAALSATANAKSAEPMTPAITAPNIFYIDPDAQTASQASARAEEIARRELDAVQTGSGTALGIPQLVPGRYLKIEDFDPMFDKKLYLTEVTHSINENGFSTSFEVGGWK